MRNRKPPLWRPSWQEAPADRLARLHRATDTQRPSAAARGYDAAWHRLRRAILAAEPHCRACAAAGRMVPASVVDHIETIRARPDLRLDPANCQPLCAACHGRKIIRADGGFGIPRKRGPT